MGIKEGGKKIAIMQPYFLPYIGYYQLMQAADIFVVYDNIQYTKKGWINRNRFLIAGEEDFFSIPLKKGSDFACVNQRFLADNVDEAIRKILRRIQENYKKAPMFDHVFPKMEEIFTNGARNLFDYILFSLLKTRENLSINGELVISSSLDVDHNLRGQERVLSICKALDAACYINPIGGTGIYKGTDFLQNGIELRFLKTGDFKYGQFQNEFVPWLSILDVMMFNSTEYIETFLRNGYELIVGNEI